jgi:organic radical activating enzyme
MKYTFDNKVEFYITNVCNLTCNNCNRFNNHRFTGWQRWSDYADTYRQWSNYIELKNIVLLGGEPLLNPTINDWVIGLSETFESGIQILSNGLRLNQTRDLYEALSEASKITGHGAHIGISLHNTNHFEQIRSGILEFLGDITEEYGHSTGDIRNNGIYYSAKDRNNVLVNVYLSNTFSSSAVIARPDGTYTLHRSDAETAHNGCGFVRYKCYHFIRGKIYKCGPVALMPEFDQQFGLDITEQEREILNSYRPMTVDAWPESGQQWIAELDNPIAQCRFCPEPKDANQQIIFPVVKSSYTDF